MDGDRLIKMSVAVCSHMTPAQFGVSGPDEQAMWTQLKTERDQALAAGYVIEHPNPAPEVSAPALHLRRLH
jgi:hypothetical protein